MRIAPHQVANFFVAFFEGREAELRAINSVAGIKKLALEQRGALESAGFTNARHCEIAEACYAWACTMSPYVDGFDPGATS